ncbi:Kunitz/Bovine pancreatic trypsin inhibitor domain protein [Necator americanus]|uniref:Kunitz/Bovine pancreatic trypsin inhibitor domain protein n=1 Tax=Necator americanus TaxID=51031 RepID=W2SVS2_NECAM|nr:Kunitz/Bovine pancreatic trypsin inhibitor domain protein [Necator americanus]ETN73829.1 Kunitz/Bovine pancreatic trypsin inhibitor domain protein [Necator americanus]
MQKRFSLIHCIQSGHNEVKRFESCVNGCDQHDSLGSSTWTVEMNKGQTASLQTQTLTQLLMEITSAIKRLSQGHAMRTFRDTYFWFAFDQKQEKCVDFVYGGCGGNQNNFETIVECQENCEDSNVCYLDIVVGPCKARIPR